MPSKGGKENPGLSQEQMLWGVLALLCTAVVCFAAGILVNKIQSKPEVASKETGQVERLPGVKDTPQRSLPTNQTKDKAGEASAAEGVQVSPAPVVMPSEALKDSAPSPSTATTQRDANTQFVPAPPPQRDDKKPETKDYNAKPLHDTPAAPTPVADATKPTETPKPAEIPMPTGTTPAPAIPDAAPITPATDVVTTTTPVTAGGFTIQVGSFDTMENAEKFKASIERKSDHKIELFPVKDSKIVKACVGSFDTKEAAAKERAELDRIKDFKGCFVKARSEL